MVPGEIRVALGRKGQGKTTIIRWIRSLGYPGQVVTVDPVAKEEHGQVVSTARAVYDLWGTGPITVRPLTSQLTDQVDRIAGLAYTLKNCLLVLDEIQKYTLPNWAPPHLADCFNTGRHVGVGILAGSRKPAKIPKDLVDEADHLYIFRQHGESAIKTVGAFTDLSPDQIKNLPDHHYFDFQEGHGCELLDPVPLVRQDPGPLADPQRQAPRPEKFSSPGFQLF